jgi:hypothetical protein
MVEAGRTLKNAADPYIGSDELRAPGSVAGATAGA